MKSDQSGPFDPSELGATALDAVAGGGKLGDAIKAGWNSFADGVNRPVKQVFGNGAQLLPTFD